MININLGPITLAGNASPGHSGGAVSVGNHGYIVQTDVGSGSLSVTIRAF
jgi:hypothetical protein